MKSSNIQHVAFIMDGNGRWASRQGLDRSHGHRAGMETLEKIVMACSERQIPYVSFYAFSTENWKRPAREIRAIFLLMEYFFRKRMKDLSRQNIRILISGDWSALPARSRDIASRCIRETAHCSGTTVNLCMNYGGQMELRRACALWAARCQETGEFSIPDESEMQDLLYSGLPDVDLMIRTGGDFRISNFLLYQIAYAELFFSELSWPEFGEKDLDEVLQRFMARDRRLGGLSTVTGAI
ncbi:MAG TPA: di-trans,poly-cis-decaprenylcistransferase [Leptospiraceae bacterium]|nr:di-trans,poly-cis-decaprenylcistransferase [Spirochaetaceae bacterium]HBS03331.1 di-trans,poly-cis-decaprenylcistransferase [Leptospiraceae bacterium]|tara:strand:- start:30631 stop:31350 length:720 start_codon:yes stop_codon:yes gene_type:complete